MKLCSAIALLLLAAPVSGLAQVGIYGGFTTSTLDTANSSRINGGTFGLQYDGSHHPLVNFGVDLRGSVLTADGEKTTTVTAGPRVVLHLPIIPLTPYGEALVGGTFNTVGQGSALTDSGGFAAGFAVGGDLHLLPFISWRVLDYSYTRLQPAHTYQSSFTTGVVLRVPFTH